MYWMSSTRYKSLRRLPRQEDHETCKIASIAGSVFSRMGRFTKHSKAGTTDYRCRSYNELPSGAQRYLNFISDQLDVPIALVSVGQEGNRRSSWKTNPRPKRVLSTAT